jgi:molybdopterin synthase catalytic subunit
MRVRVQEEPFDLRRRGRGLRRGASAAGAGAVVTFTGIVRDGAGAAGG